MNAERWQRVEQIFHGALGRAVGERARYVGEACGGDEALRREVESLLAHHQEDNFIEGHALEETARLVPEGQAVLVKGQALGRYRIISMVGAGGMGEVYAARDSALGRKVALKVLPPLAADDRDRLRRFRQEARAASALSHAHIAHIYELGEADGRPFIAMEYVEGETLRERLSKGRPTVREALDFSIQIASALVVAHGAGIVHRDIKPENVIIRRDGLAKVLDFGLAKMTGPQAFDRGSPKQHNTEPGLVMGTVNYMSPEQARGLEVDARTDIWSLGVVLYEMLAGRAPFEGETPADVLAAVIHREPPPLGRHAPAELQRIVRECLTKERDERYQTSCDMIIDLKSMRRELDLQGELERSAAPHRTGAPTVRTSGDIQTQSPQDTPSIAVLPFANISADPENEYFCAGLAEELLNALAKIEGLKVAARTSAFSFKGKNTNLDEIGRVLNVKTVLEGGVRKSGNRLRITVQLVNAADGYHLWSERYDREMKDIFDVQEDIAREIVGKLRTKLSGEQQEQMNKRHTENAEAYRLYLKARFHWNKRSPEAIRKAAEYFKQVIALDPNYAPAYTGLADAYSVLPAYDFTIKPKETMPQAKEAALKALALDDNLAEAHASLALILNSYDWDWAGAEQHYRRAIELSPNAPAPRQWLGEMLVGLGERFDEGLAECRSAVELDPLSLIANNVLGQSLSYARRYDEAITQLQKTLELDPAFGAVNFHLFETYAAKAIYGEAVAAYLRQMAVYGEPSSEIKAAQEAFTRGGWQDFLRHRVVCLEKQPKVYATDIASLYARLGEKDKAFAWLGKAYEERNEALMFLPVNPGYDNLRSDPRFTDLMRRVGLPQ
jgi:serine/threonine-protein kinase